MPKIDLLDPNLPDSHLAEDRTAADLLKVSTVTLQRWRSQGKGPAYVRVGPRRVFYPVKALRDFLRPSAGAAAA